MMERVDVYISFDTTFEEMKALKAEMVNFVTRPDNKREF